MEFPLLARALDLLLIVEYQLASEGRELDHRPQLEAAELGNSDMLQIVIR